MAAINDVIQTVITGRAAASRTGEGPLALIITSLVHFGLRLSDAEDIIHTLRAYYCYSVGDEPLNQVGRLDEASPA